MVDKRSAVVMQVYVINLCQMGIASMVRSKYIFVPFVFH